MRARGALPRGAAAASSLSGATLLSLLPAALAVVGVALIATWAPACVRSGSGSLLVYFALIVASAILAGARFRSVLTACSPFLR